MFQNTVNKDNDVMAIHLSEKNSKLQIIYSVKNYILKINYKVILEC
jgi:hypothetical protein